MKLVGGDKAIRTPEFHRKQERIRKIRFWLYGVLAIILVIAPFVLLNSSRLKIANIQISGNEVTKTEDLEKIVADDISGSYYYVVPRASSIFYPKDKIISDIKSYEARVSGVDVELQGAHTLKVSIAERTPTALYCKDVSDPTNPKECYFLDAGGYIFTKAPEFSGGVYHIYTSSPPLDSPLKHVLFVPEVLKGLEEFLKSLSNIPLAPEVVTIKDDEYDMTISNGTHVLWKKAANLDDIYSSLDSFILDPSIRKQGIGNLLYIDLRFDNKVFYKFKNE